MLAAGVLAALATTGGVISAVGWSSGSTSETFTVHAAEIPRVARPAVRAHAQPRIAWNPVRIAEDVPVQRYVVTRHLGTVTQVACDVPATTRPRCIDRFAPPGYQATYTVTARHGAHWRSTDSEPSPAVTMPGIAVPISVNGMLIVPGTGGTPVVVGAAPEAVDPSAAPSSPAFEPSAAPSGPVTEEPPVVRVPPAPPVDPVPDAVEPAAEAPDKPAPDKDHPGKDQPDKGPEKGPDEPGDKPDTESVQAPAEPEHAAGKPGAANPD
jgi:hypothetical protein